MLRSHPRNNVPPQNNDRISRVRKRRARKLYPNVIIVLLVLIGMASVVISFFHQNSELMEQTILYHNSNVVTYEYDDGRQEGGTGFSDENN